jgi:hypothetical protein
MPFIIAVFISITMVVELDIIGVVYSIFIACLYLRKKYKFRIFNGIIILVGLSVLFTFLSEF